MARAIGQPKILDCPVRDVMDSPFPVVDGESPVALLTTLLSRTTPELLVKLFELEHRAKDDPSWMTELRALHHMIEAHAREEEQMEFPKLRAALDEARCTTLLGEVQREKSMLL